MYRLKSEASMCRHMSDNSVFRNCIFASGWPAWNQDHLSWSSPLQLCAGHMAICLLSHFHFFTLSKCYFLHFHSQILFWAAQWGPFTRWISQLSIKACFLYFLFPLLWSLRWQKNYTSKARCIDWFYHLYKQFDLMDVLIQVPGGCLGFKTRIKPFIWWLSLSEKWKSHFFLRTIRLPVQTRWLSGQFSI